MSNVLPVIGAGVGVALGVGFGAYAHTDDMERLTAKIAVVEECEAGKRLPELGEDLVMYCSGVELVEVAEDTNDDGTLERTIDYAETLSNLRANRAAQPIKTGAISIISSLVMGSAGFFAGGLIDGSMRPPRRPRLEDTANSKQLF